MCLRPWFNPDGKPVACRHCWQCRKDRVSSLTGRCLAEAVTSVHSVCCTLTYRGDVPASVILVLSDVQKLLKRMRRRGWRVRYLCCGEFGSRKKRCHWHVIFFFNGEVPTLPPLRERVDWPLWPHGFSYFDAFNASSARYTVKYLLKDQFKELISHRASWSRRPPLGHDWFMARADAMVARRAIPRDPYFSFPGDLDYKGRQVSYRLQGRLLDLYLDRQAIQWKLGYGDEWPGHHAEWVQRVYSDRIARSEMERQRLWHS